MITLYGIPNCDSVRKATKWLQARNIPFAFYDYRKNGIAAEKLQQWSSQVGWQKLLNTQSTTWRQLDEATKAGAANESGAISLMNEHPTLIKRPVMEQSGRVMAVGFNEKHLQAALSLA